MPLFVPERFVRVAVPVPVDGLFTYGIPAGMDLRVGHAVQVSFGRQRMTAYVVGLADKPPPGVKAVKPVERLLDDEPALTEDQLRFCEWAAGYYLAGLGEVIGTALPAPYRGRSRRVYVPTEDGVAFLATAEADVGLTTTLLRDVVSRPGRTRSAIRRALHGEADAGSTVRSLDALVRRGLIGVEERLARAPGSRIRTVSLRGSPDRTLHAGGARMRGVLARLADAGGTMDLPDLIHLEGAGARSAVKRLEARGLVEQGEREDRNAAAAPVAGGEHGPPPTLNGDQQAALEAIVEGPARTWLLHGVTGSGKTEVYLRAAARIRGAGQQVVVLVPEIALTPQLTGRFRARFGERVAVLHSGLTSTDRLREWRRIRAGEADVAVGARSALFAPFHDLGLIIVDEEHDDSYKQDDGVRYHARDLAVVRGSQQGCPVVLGSATPALESWQNARDGRYGLLRMPHRATPRPVPQFEVCDMRGRPTGEPLAPETVDAIRDALDAGGKAIV
ncbi:MAG: primosomal protein N', partial [Myxococcota bacterium]|nr:primosomal protein N' [Myxococcota bacterium]